MASSSASMPPEGGAIQDGGCSFYGMKALLLLYLTKYHLFGDKAGLDLLGAYGGLV
ncbi:hypothetical protein HH299_19345, partial [Xanthomonas sp. Kuri4-2]